MKYFIEKLGYANKALLKQEIFNLKSDQIDRLWAPTKVNIGGHEKTLALFTACWKMN